MCTTTIPRTGPVELADKGRRGGAPGEKAGKGERDPADVPGDRRPECYIMVDADDTYPLECAGQMADKVLLEDSDMVVGDRLSSTYYEENKRPFHNMGNSLVKKSINLLFHSEIQDIMTGYRAFSYQFVKSFPVLSKGFEIETEMTIHAVYNNMQVDNVVVDYRDRPEGSESKLNTYSDGIRVLGTILRMFRQYKPLSVLSRAWRCVLTVISAACSFVPVLIAFLETGMVDKFPTLIVCGFVELAAIQSVFSGLILHNLGVKERRDFETRLYEISAQEKESGISNSKKAEKIRSKQLKIL